MHRLLKEMCAPVNHEHFLYLSSIFVLAGHGDIPSKLSEPLPPDSEPGWRLTDIPFNRGMLAAVGEARELGITEEQLKPMLHRLASHISAIEKMKGSEWVKPTQNKGEIAVAEALIRACAICKFTKNGRGLNLKDLAKQAAILAPQYP